MPDGDVSQVWTVVGVVGSVASIISIIFNLVQWLANRSLKRALDAAVCTGESAVADVENAAEAALAGHPAKHSEAIKAIRALAQSARSGFSQIRRRQLRLASRR